MTKLEIMKEVLTTRDYEDYLRLLREQEILKALMEYLTYME